MKMHSEEIILTQIYPSACGTHHVYQHKPLYPQRFRKVLKFHTPGLAPVEDATGSYHINLKGYAAYAERFKKTFGFYDGYAAVESKEGWYHITTDGSPLYEERYGWCGNYQMGFCAVQDTHKQYYHIDAQGHKLYKDVYAYVGDFKDGIAVVCKEGGEHTHIDPQGNVIHGKWFMNLDVFHKGFARARDQDGWCHVDMEGNPLYDKRFLNIEPFYNGIAYVEDKNNRLLLMDEQGSIVKVIKDEPNRDLYQLSNDMVGFWKSELIFTAIKFDIFNTLPANLRKIAAQCALPPEILIRVMRGLWELNLVYPDKTIPSVPIWHLTEKGNLLKRTPPNFMGSAAKMWEQVARHWKTLPSLLENYNRTPRPSFKLLETHKGLQNDYYNALDGYLDLDAQKIAHIITQGMHLKGQEKSIVSIGRPSKVLLAEILKLDPKLKGTLLVEEECLKTIEEDDALEGRLTTRPLNYLENWKLQEDIVLLPKILHCWPDREVKQILQNATNALKDNGSIYIVELLVEEHTSFGSLLDLNMFVEANGKLRSLREWQEIIESLHLHLYSTTPINGFMHLLQVGK
jgi:hypothetical protein